MPTDSSKKGKSKFGKKESQKYPSFVGDLPVKIVQDIIDNLATNDDWETVAGKTGVTARAIASLKTRQHTKSEMANIIFEEWLCRIPKPVDLANLLLTVNRFADVKKLKTFISPEEWRGVERKMDAKMRNAPGRPSPVGPTMASEARVTSVEESTVIYPSVAGQPVHAPTSASATVNLRGPVVEPRQVSEPQRQGDASSVMTTTMHSGNVKVPTTSAPCSSSLNPPSMEDDELVEVQTCLTRYSVYFDIVPDMLQRMPNCDHVSISMNNKWAIKRLLGRSDRSDGHKKYYREVTSLTRLRHVHIIPLSGFGIIDGEIYLVYPYLPNGTLQSQLTTNLAFKDYQLCIWMMLQVLSALCYIHSAGFMHGDISMSNILLDDQLHPYLADFEHSVNLRERHYETNSDVRVGTEPYRPPFRVRYPSLEVDIHAFGILLALVSNQRLWKGGSEKGVALVESLFQARTTPNLQRAHNLLRSVCLQCVQATISPDWDMEQIEHQVMYAYKTVIDPNCDECLPIDIPNISEPLKKGIVAMKDVIDLQRDIDSDSSDGC